MDIWRDQMGEKLTRILSQTDAITSLRDAVNGLAAVVDSQRAEAISRHTDMGKMYLEMLDSVAVSRKEVTENSDELRRHKRNEGTLLKFVILLSGVLLAPLTVAIISGWDSQISPVVAAAFRAFIGI